MQKQKSIQTTLQLQNVIKNHMIALCEVSFVLSLYYI